MQSRHEECRGFTLVEVIASITIIAVLAAVALPRVTAATPFAERGYADGIAASLRLARAVAIASGCDVQFTIDAAGYRALQRAAAGTHCARRGRVRHAGSTRRWAGSRRVAARQRHRGQQPAVRVCHGWQCRGGAGGDHGGNADRHGRCDGAGAVIVRRASHRRQRGVTLMELVVSHRGHRRSRARLWRARSRTSAAPGTPSMLAGAGAVDRQFLSQRNPGQALRGGRRRGSRAISTTTSATTTDSTTRWPRTSSETPPGNFRVRVSVVAERAQRHCRPRRAAHRRDGGLRGVDSSWSRPVIAPTTHERARLHPDRAGGRDRDQLHRAWSSRPCSSARRSGAYEAHSRRAVLVADTAGAWPRMESDLNAALPNSLRARRNGSVGGDRAARVLGRRAVQAAAAGASFTTAGRYNGIAAHLSVGQSGCDMS